MSAWWKTLGSGDRALKQDFSPGSVIFFTVELEQIT